MMAKGRNLMGICGVLLVFCAVLQVSLSIFSGKFIAVRKDENTSEDGKRNSGLWWWISSWGRLEMWKLFVAPLQFKGLFGVISNTFQAVTDSRYMRTHL